MRRIKITGLALVAGLAITAIAADTASAKLTLSEGGVPLAVGRTFEVYSKESIPIKTSQGNFNCFLENPASEEGAGLELEVTKTPDSFRVVRGRGFFGLNEVAKECRTENGFGHAEILLVSSAPLRLSASGKAAEGAVILRFGFERGPEECYFRGPFRGVVNATLTRQPLEIEYSGKLTLDKPLTHFEGCPTFVEMRVGYPLTRNEEFGEGIIEEQI